MKAKLFLASFLNAAVASAAIINVTNTNDSGPGSLRAAFSTAQSGDQIDITATGTISLQSALPIIQGFSIQGPGTNQLTINGGGATNAFYVYSGTSTISNLTLADFTSQGGNGGSGGGGGGGALGAGAGVFVDSGTSATLQNIAFVQNSSVGGAGGAVATGNAGGGGGGLNYSNGGNSSGGSFDGGGGGGGLNFSNGGNSSSPTPGAGGGGGGGGGISNSPGGSSEGSFGGAGGGGFLGSPGGNSNNGALGAGGGGGVNGFSGGNCPSNTFAGGGGGGTTSAGGDAGFTTGGAGGGPQMNGEGGGAGGQGLIPNGNGSPGLAVAGGGGGAGGNGGGDATGGSSPMLGGGGGGGGTANNGSGGSAYQGGGGGGGNAFNLAQGGPSNKAGGGGGGGAAPVSSGGNATNGGGGGGFTSGGNSTFAGGGGGALAGNTAGTGGFGGGNGGAGAEGGAGSGLGGAVFVREGGSLTIIDCQFSGDSTAVGTGLGSPVSDGKDMYLMNGTTTTFTVSDAATVTPIFLAGGIGEPALGGSLTKQGAGTLLIDTQGIGSYDGDITVDAGTLNAAGLINSLAQVNPGGTLIGTGYLNTINNDGKVQPGSNSFGTLSAGTYTQSAGGTLINQINPSGATDLLQVTNTATLNGTLQVVPDPGMYFIGETFTFLTAGGGVTGTFSQATSTFPLSFQVLYFPNFVELKITQNSLRPDCPAFGGNPGTIRNYLTNLPLSPSGQTAQALRNLATISCSDFKKALGELDPTRYIDFDWANASTLTLIRRNIEQRGRPGPCACECEEPIRGGTWVATEGGHVQLSRLNSLPAFHANERIYLGGIDRRVNSDLLVGLGGGYSRTHLHWTQIGGRGKIEGYHIIPYVNYSKCAWDFDGSIIASAYRLKGRRPMNFGAFHHTAQTTHNGVSVLAHGGVTYNLPWGEYVFTPLAGVDYIYLHRRRFTENGGNGLGLKVDAHTTQFIEGRLGAAAARCFELCGGRLIPTLQGSVVSLSPISGYYQEAGIRGFSRKFRVRNTHKTLIQGAPLAQLTYELHDRVSISALYEGFFARKWQEHSYSATLAWNF